MLRKVDPTPGACTHLFSGLFGNSTSQAKLQLDFSKNNLTREVKGKSGSKKSSLEGTCIEAIAQEIRSANNFCVHKLLLESCSLGPQVGGSFTTKSSLVILGFR